MYSFVFIFYLDSPDSWSSQHKAQIPPQHQYIHSPPQQQYIHSPPQQQYIHSEEQHKYIHSQQQQQYIYSQYQQQGFISPESGSSLWPELPQDRSSAQSPPPGYAFAPKRSTERKDFETPADLRLIHPTFSPDESLSSESEQVSDLLIAESNP